MLFGWFRAVVKILRLETEAIDLAWRTAIGFGCDYGGWFRL